ncbi:DUF4861 domain-containing protein [Algoriphagus sp. H41]|uniref:DUF4861 domain-containing protein n=1 Tax=Algoriphagus oliviformis TaxID=2811231 RepID=A0ABS3C358_9BACT|nr:DUF4861 domain-containing protein [Algoriphagus oliviformis]MBN7811305.1 DUF4861 domain-containing protein [Algoriphagus oliviformis]
MRSLPKIARNLAPVLVCCTVLFAQAASGAFAQKAPKPKALSLAVENTLSQPRANSLVHLSVEELSRHFSVEQRASLVVTAGKKEIPSQWNAKGPDQGLVFVLPEIGADETLSLQVFPAKGKKKAYPKLTQAEISHKVDGHFEDREYIGGRFVNVDSLHVPAEHTDHSWFIRYEGPGWESDLVGYRFYLDWRNGIDVFGKKVHTPVLQDVGQDGFDSYHEPADWGMDVLKVGKTLGLGSIATWEKGAARRVDVTDHLFAEITSNGPVYSSVFTKYSGWDLAGGKTDILASISIHSGTRMSRMDLVSSNAIDNFATGLIKDPKAELIQSGKDQAFAYLATYGKQSLNDDNLGIAVIYPTAQLREVTQDELSHVVVFDGGEKKLSYYFLAAWELEPGGITTKQEFVKSLDKAILELSNPLKVTFK